MAHTQCAKKLSQLRSSMHALISCELAFTQARLQHNHPRVRVRRTHCQTPSSGGSHKLPAWRATTTPALHQMHQPESTLALTLQWSASTFRGNKQREILKSSNGMKTFDLQAFALHGSRCMLTHFSHFSGANCNIGPRNSERIRVRHVSACDSDVAVCRPSCRGNFNKTTSCTWPRNFSTCSTTPS